VRTLITAMLVFVLATCPLWCASAQAAPGLHAHHGTSAHADSDLPSHPANDDDCICNGAVQPGFKAARASDLDPDGLPLPLDAPLAVVASTFPPPAIPGVAMLPPDRERDRADLASCLPLRQNFRF
jgi:hypothetical protein